MGDDGFDRVGIFAKYNDFLLGMLGMKGFEPAFEGEQLSLRPGAAGDDKLFQLDKRFCFFRQSAKFATAALHGREVAAVKVALQTRLGFLGDGLAAANGAQVLAADLDFGDGLGDVLPTLGDSFSY